MSPPTKDLLCRSYKGPPTKDLHAHFPWPQNKSNLGQDVYLDTMMDGSYVGKVTKK